MTLAERLSWSSFAIPATIASPTIAVNVGRIGSGSPVGLIVAGQHGDEGPWGNRAIHKFLQSTSIDDLKGSLRVVPIANPLAFEENARTAHIDGEDVNMEFPGDPRGKHTQRLAAGLREHALDGVDIVLDIHGGGSWCVNCFAYQFPGSEDVAQAIGAPFIRNGPDRGETSLTGYALARGAKAVWIEVGGAGSNEERWAQLVADGLRRALGNAGVLTSANLPPVTSAYATGEAASIRTSMPGLYQPGLREDDLATVVPKGTIVGTLVDPVTGKTIETYTAPFERTVIMLLRPTIAVMEGGEMVSVLASADS